MRIILITSYLNAIVLGERIIRIRDDVNLRRVVDIVINAINVDES
jgi:hypothetical protein